MSLPHDYFLNVAHFVASNSRDTSRKTGCVFVRGGQIVARGYNAFPPCVHDTPARRERPHKYVFTEHAERRAIYKAAREGVILEDSIVYLTWFPCVDCARAIVAVGSKRLFCYEPDWSEERYGFVDARTILEEGGVDITFMERT